MFDKAFVSNIFDSVSDVPDIAELTQGSSYQEKTAWITLVGMLGGYSVYAVVAWGMWTGGADRVPAYAPLFTLSVVGLVVFMVLAHIVAAVGSRHDDPERVDERDRLIARAAESRSSWMVAVGVLVALTGMVFMVNNVLVAHVLLGSLVLSEVTKATLQVVAYRRGV